MKRRSVLAAAFAAVLATEAARGQSLVAAVPANAKIAIVVRDLDAFLEQSNVFVADGCGLPVPKPKIDEITNMFGRLGSAWKTSRGVGIAISELTPEGAAVLFPVADAAGTLAKIAGETVDGTTKFDLVGRTMFGAAKGDVLVVGPAAAAVKAAQGPSAGLAEKLNGMQKQFAETDQVFFYLNLLELKPELEKLANESGKLGELLSQLPGEAKKLKPEQVADALKKIANGLGREGQAIYGSVNFTRDVAVLRLGIEFKEGGRAKAALANFPPGGADLFAKLPEGSFVAALGADLKGIVEGGKLGGQAQDLGLGVLGLALTESKEGSVLLGRVTAGDAAALNQTVGGLLALAPVFAGNRPEVKLSLGKQKVGGADVNELKAVVAAIPEQGKELMQVLLGGADLRLQHGVVDGALGFAIGGRADAFAALQGGGNLGGTTRVREATRHLPTGATVAGLVDPLAGLRLAQRIMAKTKPDERLAKAELPAEPGTPFAFAATLGKDGAVMHFAVPSIAVKNLAPALQAIGQ